MAHENFSPTEPGAETLTVFSPNYPFYDDDFTMLTLHQRMGGLHTYAGRGVTMAFLDSGFYPHPDLGERVLLHVDASTDHFVEGRKFFHARDFSWHGQMTSVLACGDGRTSGLASFRGLASAAHLVLIKVTNPHGRIKEPDIMRGMRWLLRNHTRFNIRVVNISVGGDWENDDPHYELHSAARDLYKAGIVITAASGNANHSVVLPPASAPEVLTIGGYDDRNTRDVTQWRVYHHNYGKAHDGSLKPDLLGTANWIPSPLLPGSTIAREAKWLARMLAARDQAAVNQLLLSAYSDLNMTREQAFRPDQRVYKMLEARLHAHKIIDANHQHVDGTSVSSALVASVVAQMLEANPSLRPDNVREILTATAKCLPDVPEARQGAGIMDAEQAVLAAERTRKAG